jgi:hypothetical protein
VQNDRQLLGEAGEIFIVGKDGMLPSHRDRTDQKISIGVLDTLGSTRVGKFRRYYVIVIFEAKVGESGKMPLQFGSLCAGLRTRRLCPPKPSCPRPLLLVVETGHVIDRAKKREDILLLKMTDIILKRLRHRGLLGAVLAKFDRPHDQFVIDLEVGCHGCVHT